LPATVTFTLFCLIVAILPLPVVAVDYHILRWCVAVLPACYRYAHTTDRCAHCRVYVVCSGWCIAYRGSLPPARLYIRLRFTWSLRTVHCPMPLYTQHCRVDRSALHLPFAIWSITFSAVHIRACRVAVCYDLRCCRFTAFVCTHSRLNFTFGSVCYVAVRVTFTALPLPVAFVPPRLPPRCVESFTTCLRSRHGADFTTTFTVACIPAALPARLPADPFTVWIALLRRLLRFAFCRVCSLIFVPCLVLRCLWNLPTHRC